MVAITRSGTTTEVLDLLAALRRHRHDRASSATPDARPVELAGDAVALPFADERSVVQTRFATTALALLRAGLGEDVAALAADAARALADAAAGRPGHSSR